MRRLPRRTRESSTAGAKSVALWVVPRESIMQIEEFVDELQRNYHRVDGYPLKAKLKEARERAGTAALPIATTSSSSAGGTPSGRESPVPRGDVAFSSIAGTRSVTPGRCTSSSPRRWAGPPTSSHSTGHRRYRRSRLVDLRLVPDWARTARHVYEAADADRLQALKASDDPDVAGLAAKIDREEAYHRLHAQMWQHRLAGEPRFAEALDELRPLLEERGRPGEFSALWEEMTMVRRSVAGATW